MPFAAPETDLETSGFKAPESDLWKAPDEDVLPPTPEAIRQGLAGVAHAANLGDTALRMTDSARQAGEYVPIEFSPSGLEIQPPTPEELAAMAEQDVQPGIQLPSMAPSRDQMRRFLTLSNPFAGPVTPETDPTGLVRPPEWLTSAATGAVEGVDTLGRGVVEFGTTPSGAAQLASLATPLAPLTLAKFTYDMGKGAKEAAERAGTKFGEGDIQGGVAAATEALGLAAGGKGSAGHLTSKLGKSAEGYVPRGAGIESPSVARGEPIAEPKSEAPLTEAKAPEVKAELPLKEREVGPLADKPITNENGKELGDKLGIRWDGVQDWGMGPGKGLITMTFEEGPAKGATFYANEGATGTDVRTLAAAKLSEFEAAEAKKSSNSNAQEAPATAAGNVGEQSALPAAAPVEAKPVEAMAQGPGAMTRRESAKPAQPESIEGTGLKHAIDELERTSYGFGERPQQERQAMAEAWLRAGEAQAANPLAGPELAKKLIENPKRGLTGDESALILRHKVALENALNNAAEKTITATTPELKVEAQAEFDAASNALKEFMDAVNERGSEWGREGRWRQAIAYEDFTFATQERLLRASKGGDPLTEGERAQLQAEINTHKATITKLEKELESAKVNDAQAEVSDVVKAVRTQSKKDKASGKVRDLDAEQKDVVQHLKESFLENEADLSGEGMSIRKLMELLVEREGITERLKMEDRIHEILTKEIDPTITRQEAMDLMSNYGKSKLPNPAFAKRVVRDINAQILSVRKLLDYFKGDRPKLTGQLRDAPSQIQRDWQKMVNEAKKAFKLEDVGDSAKLIKSAIDAINTRLTNRIKDLKSEIVTRQKIIRERQPSPYNADTLRLRKELEQTQQAHREIFGEPKLTDAQKLDRAEKAADRQIVELERQIKSGEIFPKSKQVFGLRSEKLDAAKSRLEELKMQRQFARESIQPKPEPHEAFALNYLLRLRQRSAEYNERAARGDFTKPAKPVRELSADVLKAMADVEQSKQNFHRARYEAAQALRSLPRKIWDGIKQTKNAFVNIMSSYDLSAPRQMFLALLANSSRLALSPIRLATKKVTGPREAARLAFIPMGRMFQALSSEARSRSLEQWRKNRPNAMSGADKVAGIQYTELHTIDFTRWEENAHSVLDDWAQLPVRTGNAAKTIATAVPKVAAKGVRASNRAFITALNTQRAMLFDHLLETNFKDRAPTKVELEVLGNLVNVSTGRGKLSRGVAKATGEVLWSPSLFASRIQALIGQPLWGGGEWKGSGRARKIVAKEYARWLISGAALYGISRIFDDKEVSDSTSSDTGKVVRGKTRIDPWAGFQQPVVLASRIAKGKSTSIQGKERKLSNYDTGAVIFNFLKNKTRPDIVAAVKVAIAAIDSGKTGKAVRVTPMEAAKSAVPVPLALQEVIAVMRERGMTEGAIIQVLSEFGVGVNTYEERESQK